MIGLDLATRMKQYSVGLLFKQFPYIVCNISQTTYDAYHINSAAIPALQQNLNVLALFHWPEVVSQNTRIAI